MITKTDDGGEKYGYGKLTENEKDKLRSSLDISGRVDLWKQIRKKVMNKSEEGFFYYISRNSAKESWNGFLKEISDNDVKKINELKSQLKKNRSNLSEEEKEKIRDSLDVSGKVNFWNYLMSKSIAGDEFFKFGYYISNNTNIGDFSEFLDRIPDSSRELLEERQLQFFEVKQRKTFVGRLTELISGDSDDYLDLHGVTRYRNKFTILLFRFLCIILCCFSVTGLSVFYDSIENGDIIRLCTSIFFILSGIAILGLYLKGKFEQGKILKVIFIFLIVTVIAIIYINSDESSNIHYQHLFRFIKLL